MRALLIGVALIVATASAASGQIKSKGPIKPLPLPSLAACAQGFTAAPATYDDTKKTGQSYTCTGPAAVCSATFTVQPIAVPVPPTTPGSFGSTINVPGVPIKNGKMVYTCAQPPTLAQ